MKEKNISFRREELEKLSTLELDQILRAELDSDAPERETVLLVLSILEDRDPTNSQNRPEGAEEAWDDFVNRTSYSKQPIEKPIRKARKWFLPVAAAAAIVLILLISVPQAVGAENIFEILGRWTRDLFSFSNEVEEQSNETYIFQTDHEGLQQLYDAVVEQGVTAPVVPTWIPEGYQLEELKIVSKSATPKTYARFFNNSKYIQFMIEIYDETLANQYPKDDADAEVYNSEGIYYYILTNEDTIKVVWNNKNTECSLVTNDTEKTVWAILNSIQGRRKQWQELFA